MLSIRIDLKCRLNENKRWKFLIFRGKQFHSLRPKKRILCLRRFNLHVEDVTRAICRCESVDFFLPSMLSMFAEANLHPSLMVNPILAEQIYIKRTMRAIPKNIYSSVQQFFTVKILIYSATFTDFFNANLIIFLGDIEVNTVLSDILYL